GRPDGRRSRLKPGRAWAPEAGRTSDDVHKGIVGFRPRQQGVTPFARAVIVVFDSAGVGELPDAEQYGDVGSSTLPHTAQAVGGLHVPHLESLGLGRIVPLEGVASLPSPTGAFGKL